MSVAAPAPRCRPARTSVLLVAVAFVVLLTSCGLGARPTLQAEASSSVPRTAPRPRSKGTVAGVAAGAAAGGTTPGAINVGVVGDSLTVGVQDNLPRDARDRGFTVEIDAKKGREIPEGIKVLQKLAPGKDLVVIALGTNDARVTLDAKGTSDLIEQALAAAGDTMAVLWVNIYRDPKTDVGKAAIRFNEVLDSLRAAHPNLTLADWAAVMKTKPKLMAGDGIHLTDEGYKLRSAWLADQIVELATRLQPT